MATSVLFSLPSLTLLALTLFLLFSAVASSTSRRALDRSGRPAGLRATLRHVDAGGNHTRLEILRRATARGRKRVERLGNGRAEEEAVDVGEGDFLVEMAIGTPARRFVAVMDTGSDLVWTQCKPCRECFRQSVPVFDPRRSSSFNKVSCSSAVCMALPRSHCRRSACKYSYTYADYSSTQGTMATETLSFDKTKVKKIAFGCGSENLGSGFGQGSGILGLGRGPLSLISQLKEPKFSYCLTSLSDATTTSTLLMGPIPSHRPNNKTRPYPAQTTRLLTNKHRPSLYYLPLQGISVGPTRLPVKKSPLSLRRDGTGGFVIDSGTTITYLEHSVFNLVMNEFVSQMRLPVDGLAAEALGLDLCFRLPAGEVSMEVPRLVFHFEGADLDFPAGNYLIEDTELGIVCLGIGRSRSGLSVFGNFQQQNFLVTHDLRKETVSFLQTRCDEI